MNLSCYGMFGILIVGFSMPAAFAKISIDEALRAPGRMSRAARGSSSVRASLKAVKNVTRAPAAAGDPGALVRVRLASSVGVLLDEFPASIRGRVGAKYLLEPASFWKARAKMQIETTLYRLVYRNLYYARKGQLPLPPEELWSITVSQPSLTTIDGHSFVAVNYAFESTLLTAESSPGIAEPRLALVGGQWSEPFMLPIDPELLFERTGYACMDEEDFPPNSVDSENARAFYDHTCKAGSNGCHVTLPVPKLSCSAALKARVGRVAATADFERLAWNSGLADQVRLGSSNPGGADLAVLGKGVENNRLIYRYIPKNSCAIAEGCVGGSGWRRLLQFDASVENRGSEPAHLGDVGPTSALFQQNMFEFSACHGHNHFSHYGKFTYGTGTQALGSKRAFCLESTSRYSNNESTPLTHPYDCHYQGIQAGWGDDYIAGIDCQWIDVTPVKGPVNAPLGFESNPDQFICEGAPVLDAAGNFTFVATPFRTETGQPVNRIACEFSPNYNQNNFQSRTVSLPAEGSYVTQACQRGQDTAARNCGFRAIGLGTCAAGEKVTLNCKVKAGAAPQALRICEASHVLKTGTACTYREARANAVIEGTDTNFEVAFTCPAARDAGEPGGFYSRYTAPVHAADASAPVNCTVR